MIVLVRCVDNTVTVAMESSLPRLIHEGLIVSVLRSGEWTEITPNKPGWIIYPSPVPEQKYTAFVSCF